MSDESVRALQLLTDLDRCEHGRHAGDPCSGCGGDSPGNPHMTAGQTIGYGLDGVPIVFPGRGNGKYKPSTWYQR